MTELQKIPAEIRAQLLSRATLTQRAAKRFFKTSPGAYSEKEEFIGVTVPVLRKMVQIFKDITPQTLRVLLCSSFNEERLLALLILVHQYQQGDKTVKEERYLFYVKHLQYVNNWNLVDASAHLILGDYLSDKDRSLLERLAQSDVVWERRVAIVSTWHFIRQRDLDTTFRIAGILLKDTHDLIHKAVGWMLREAGKRNEAYLLNFLHQHVRTMPKTMFRYATEKLSSEQKLEICHKVF